MLKIVYRIKKLYWFIFRPVTFGVKALVKKDDQVLLIKNTYRGKLMFPGGGVKKDETPEEAIKRELKEEVGVVVEKLHLLGKYQSRREYKQDTIYFFEIDKYKTIRVPKSFEIDYWAFYDLNNLPSNVSPATKRRLENIKSTNW